MAFPTHSNSEQSAQDNQNNEEFSNQPVVNQSQVPYPPSANQQNFAPPTRPPTFSGNQPQYVSNNQQQYWSSVPQQTQQFNHQQNQLQHIPPQNYQDNFPRNYAFNPQTVDLSVTKQNPTRGLNTALLVLGIIASVTFFTLIFRLAMVLCQFFVLYSLRAETLSKFFLATLL